MLPARFEYHRPATLDEALALLAEHGEDAKVLAGGQSLIPLMKLRFAEPAHLIDINRIDGLDGIEETDGELRIGAMVRHNQLAASEVIQKYPMIAHAAPQIADPLVRNLGTIGGSLAHCDPSGDLGAVMLAANARVVLRSTGGEREVPMQELIVGTFQTSIAPNEMLTEIRIMTPPSPTYGGTYLKLERKVGDFATVAAATRLMLEDGKIKLAGIGLTSVGLTNIKATAAEESLIGKTPNETAFAEAGSLAAEAAHPVTDVRGSADYKKHMVDVYVRRGLARAAEMAGAA